MAGEKKAVKIRCCPATVFLISATGIMALVNAHPERGNFWMELSAVSYQPSAKSLF
jgi:hypothetical protein